MAKDKEENNTEETQPAGDATVTAPEPQQPQTQLRIDESKAAITYSSTSRLSGTAEEIVIDFSQGIKPGPQPNTAILQIDSKVILSPWAAKRLALALNQTIQRYEQAYGALEIDPRKRQLDTTTTTG
ncbi:MAG: DUF3467 domain-containing protein [Planctomycetota bacterium]|jgi:hypothetical protein